MQTHSMKCALSLFLSLILAFNLAGQSFVLLNDDSQIVFDQLSIKNDHLHLNLPSGEKQDIPFDQVEGFYSEALATFFYKRSAAIYPDEPAEPAFMERVVEGRFRCK
jgi:hypothetical protein